VTQSQFRMKDKEKKEKDKKHAMVVVAHLVDQGGEGKRSE